MLQDRQKSVQILCRVVYMSAGAIRVDHSWIEVLGKALFVGNSAAFNGGANAVMFDEV